jgi:hypothetical protein
MLRLGRDAVHSLRPARSKVVVKLGVQTIGHLVEPNFADVTPMQNAVYA